MPNKLKNVKRQYFQSSLGRYTKSGSNMTFVYNNNSPPTTAESLWFGATVVSTISVTFEEGRNANDKEPAH